MRSCLLDTHALIWLLSEKEKLSAPALRRLERTDTELFISIVSLWEVVLKHQAGRLWAPHRLIEFMDVVRSTGALHVMGITADHLEQLIRLPVHTGHKDPYDRLLIAQALYEEFDIVTADPRFARYGVKVVW